LNQVSAQDLSYSQKRNDTAQMIHMVSHY